MEKTHPYRFPGETFASEQKLSGISDAVKNTLSPFSQHTTQYLKSTCSLGIFNLQAAHSSSKLFHPKVYLHKMGKRIDANHCHPNVTFNWCGMTRRRRLVEPELGETAQLASPLQLPTSADCDQISLEFRSLRSQLLEKLRQLLMHSKFYSLHDILKQKDPNKKDKSAANRRKEREAASVYSELLGQVQQKDNQEQADDLSEPSESVGEANLDDFAEEERTQLLEVMKHNFPTLITEAAGSYVVQQAIKKSEHLAAQVAGYCSERLETLIKNENASRVMQTLVELSKQFREEVLRWYSIEAISGLDSLPSVFLIAAALNRSEGFGEFRSLRDTILSGQNRRLMANKFFRRFLVTFIEKCDRADLEVVYRTFKMAPNLTVLLSDKFGTLSLLAMLLREHRPLEKLFINQIRTNIIELFQTKFFKILVFRLIKSQGNWSLVRSINQALMGVPKELLAMLLKSSEAAYFYCSLFVSTAEPLQRKLLTTLDLLLSHPTGLRKFLLGT